MANLAALPEELLQQIADLLDRRSQKDLALANSRLWDPATSALWRDLKLIDQRSHYHCSPRDVELFTHCGVAGRDEHDDLPIIRKLLVLAQNKRLALKVRVVTHRCHLPLPAIFQDLPRMVFENKTLSSDWRTVQLAPLAAQNMENVRALRLVNGHHNLVAALLNGFYGREREYVPPHLWVESCSLHGFPLRFGSSPAKSNGLQSVRFRRLKLGGYSLVRSKCLSRAGELDRLHDGAGSKTMSGQLKFV